MNNKSMHNIVAFCALMQNEGGILEKSPDYIMEKFDRYCLSRRCDSWKFGLDTQNSARVIEWMVKWGIIN